MMLLDYDLEAQICKYHCISPELKQIIITASIVYGSKMKKTQV